MSMKTRREFLAGAAIAGAAAGAFSPSLARGTQDSSTTGTSSASSPTAAQADMETGSTFYTAAEEEQYFIDRPVSDFMVDVIHQLNIDYVAVQCASSFRGLHESIVNYGGNSRPELLTAMHEESAVAMAHGYYKIAGKPMATLAHSTVGFQHAAMAVYNAWCDRVPVLVLGGNYKSFNDRKPLVSWAHSAQDPVNVLRDYIKWDAAPTSPEHFAEAAVRAYKIATTPPMGPVVIDLDHELMERSALGAQLAIPELSATIPPQGDTNAVKEAARLLVGADRPVIVVDNLARTPVGVARLVELAEMLQAPVVDRLGRMNFPNTHYLNQLGRSGAITEADVILGLELTDFWGVLHQMRDLAHSDVRQRYKADAKLIHIGVGDLYLKSNYQDFQRYQPADLSIGGDGEATLPALIDAIRQETSRRRRSTILAREADWRRSHSGMRRHGRQTAALAWNARPISTARLCMEVWHQIKDHDYSLVALTAFQNYWPNLLWEIEKHHNWTGGSGGFGIGYMAPAAAGVALANRGRGRLTVCIQSDGDLMYGPGVLWTAAHHRLPVLYVMHNNRAYHQEIMHVQRMALRRRRGVDGAAKIGNVIEDPNINYAALAKGLGVWSVGPVEDPQDLRTALGQAVRIVRDGEPALVDVVCQPR